MDFGRLVQAKNLVIKTLEQKGIEARYLKFGGEAAAPTRSPTVPTDARSEFLANRAMGDWAERTLAAAIRKACPDSQVSHYGIADKMAAGDEGFREFFLGGLDEVRKYGKRPDLLMFPKTRNVTDDISSLPFSELDKLVPEAIGALEVRSSKFEALKFIAVRKQEREEGKSGGRETPSFTVKVEDLKIVYRWMERWRKPQEYVQVFFDSVFAINVLTIFEIIGSGRGFLIETPAKSQEKSTIMIPITSGSQVGTFTALPAFKAEEKITRLGRHDAYVVPVGGDLRLDGDALCRLLLG